MSARERGGAVFKRSGMKEGGRGNEGGEDTSAAA